MIKFYKEVDDERFYMRRWAVENGGVTRMVSIIVKESPIRVETADLVSYYAGISILNPEDTYNAEREFQICEGRVRKMSEYKGVVAGWYEGRYPIAVMQKDLKSQRILEEIFQKTLSLTIKKELSKYHHTKGVNVDEITDENLSLMGSKLSLESNVEAEHTS